jgi:hypothetical protein
MEEQEKLRLQRRAEKKDTADKPTEEKSSKDEKPKKTEK